VGQLTSTAGWRKWVAHGTDKCRDKNLLSYLGMEVLGNLAETYSSIGPYATLQTKFTMLPTI
jgi:hypothetical protein